MKSCSEQRRTALCPPGWATVCLAGLSWLVPLPATAQIAFPESPSTGQETVPANPLRSRTPVVSDGDAWTAASNPVHVQPRGDAPRSIPARPAVAQAPGDAALRVRPSQAELNVASQPLLAQGGRPRSVEDLLAAQSGPAGTPIKPPSSTAEDESVAGTSTLQMLFSVGSSLLLVVGLFLGVAWCYRRSLGSELRGGLPKEVVKILGRSPIAPRQQLLLLRFGSKLLLVSLVQGEARTLSEVTDPLEVDRLAGLCEQHGTGSITHSFKTVLGQGGAV